MKPPAAWLELALVAGGLMAAMLVVMWAQRPAAGCTLPFEAPRVLVLSRETDREHLATDLSSAARIARRYTFSTVDPAQQQTRFLECEATLVRQIATTHSLSPNELPASPVAAR